jgi:hypothetical protein
VVRSDPMPYHPAMTPPPFVVAVVGSHEPVSAEVRTAAWVAGRDIAWAGAWLAVDVGGWVAGAAIAGARDHQGVVLGFCSHEYRLVTADTIEASLVIRSGLNRPAHAAVVAANADALLAFPGDPESMAIVAAALERGIPAAQVATDLWPVRPLTPVEVPAWLDELIRTASAPETPDPPPAPILTDGPQRNTPGSESDPPNTPSSSLSASDATSSRSPTTPTSEPSSTSGTATE